MNPEVYKAEVEDLRRLAKDTLLVMLYGESQIGRSISAYDKKDNTFNKEKFKKIVLEETRRLGDMVDNKTLTNKAIRDAILDLSEKGGVTIGHAQKILNVYLKYYSLLTGSPPEIISELDCPLDGIIMNHKERIMNIQTFEKYLKYQDRFEKNGIRLIEDKKYDEQKISNFISDKIGKNRNVNGRL